MSNTTDPMSIFSTGQESKDLPSYRTTNPDNYFASSSSPIRHISASFYAANNANLIHPLAKYGTFREVNGSYLRPSCKTYENVRIQQFAGNKLHRHANIYYLFDDSPKGKFNIKCTVKIKPNTTG